MGGGVMGCGMVDGGVNGGGVPSNLVISSGFQHKIIFFSKNP
jgi:hypothetical protein